MTSNSLCSPKKEHQTTAEIMNMIDSLITLIFPFFGLLIMNAIIIRTLKNSSYNFSNRTSITMRKVSFKNKKNQMDSLNSQENNYENEEILEKKYKMCRCHQDQLKKIESSSKDFQHTDQQKISDSSKLLCCKFTKSPERRNSIELSGVTVKPNVQKKYLISYKLDRFNRLQKKEGETQNGSKSSKCNKCTASRFNRPFKFSRRCSNNDIQPASRSRKSSSLEISRGKH